MDQNDKALGRAMTAGAALTALAAALALLEGKGPRPVTALGRWLRDMSLSGAGGDALAWLVTAALSLAPAAAVWLLLGRTKRRWADALLPLTVPLVFAAVFYAVNPTLGGSLGWLLPAAALSTTAAALLAWVVLRFLGALADAPRERLAAALGVLLTACGAFMALAAAWNGFAQWQAGAEAVRAANTGARETAERTVAVQGLLALLELLPSLLGAAALLELLAGLVQLLLFRSLASTSFHLRLSLTPLAVTAALYLLCQWFQQGRALKADNDSII